MIVVKCYQFRLRPTRQQEEAFRRFAGCRRFVWNWALRRKKDHYADTGKNLTYNALAAELVALKKQPGMEFLRECPSQALQQTLLDLETAFKNLFEHRARYPKFKNKKRTPHAFRLPQNVFVSGNTVLMPKLKRVNAVIHREMEGTIKSATFKQAANGHWHVTFVSHVEKPDFPEPTADNPVGIDVGLKSFVTLDDGTKIDPPKFYRREQHKLRRLQRHLSKCEKGSRNRGKARRKVAKFHAKVKNRRADFLHKVSARIVQEHDTLCIEDLNLRGLARTKLAKSFSDAAIGNFNRMLDYKAQWQGKRLVKVDRWFPSSKTCHGCGSTQALTLSDREWVCTHCGALHDRDQNAAINIKVEGLRLVAVGITETLNAYGEDVRPATVGSPC